MTSRHSDNSAERQSLRQRAEQSVSVSRTDIAGMSTEEVQRVVHELQIHQVELEMQNEELREAQFALAKAHDRFIDLYDFAPVGYVSLNADGVIVEANLAAAQLLGVARSQLLHTNINRFLPPDCQDDAWRHRQHVLAGENKQAIELSMHSADGTPLVVRLESIAAGHDSRDHCRTALIDVTTVKRAQQLQESEARYRELSNTLEQRVSEQTREVRLLAKAMASLGEGVVITGDGLEWPEPKIIFVNEAVCQITGYPAEELIGRSPRMLQGERTDRKVLNELRQALKDGGSHRCEVVSYRRDGTAYDAEWFISPLFDTDGRRTNFIAIHRDITIRRQAEARLRDRQERLNAILNTASDGIVIIDVRGVIDDVNPATEAMFGYDREELIGQNVSLLLPSPYREEHDGYIRRYLETGNAHIIGISREVTGQRKDGATFPVDLAVSEVSHMGLFTGAIRDLSERSKVEEKLRREQELTANIFDTAQNIILLLDPQGRIIHFNPYMANLTGWSLEEVQGRSWFELFLRKADRPGTQKVFGVAMSGQHTRGSVSVILTKDGREREVEWYDAPLTDAAGNLIGLLCSGQDVTENRLLARHVLNAATEEQRRIGQDLHDSLGQELAGLTMMADALTRSMKQASAEVAGAVMDVPGRPQHIRIAEQLTSGLKETLTQLKAVARGLHPVEIDPRGLHSSLHELAQHVSAMYGVACSFEGNDQIDIGNVDTATHLYRIAQEASTNAVTHGQAGHIRISLEGSAELVSLRIRDDGAGMPSDAGSRGGLGLRAVCAIEQS